MNNNRQNIEYFEHNGMGYCSIGTTSFDQTDERIRSSSAFVMEKSEFDDKCLCDIVISPDKSVPNNPVSKITKDIVRITKVNISDNDELLAYIKTDEVLEQLYNLCKGITDGFFLITNWNDYNIYGSLKSAFDYCNEMNYNLNKMPIFICYNRNHTCKTLWSANTIDFTTVNYFVDLPNLDTRILATDETFVKMCKKLFGGNDKED